MIDLESWLAVEEMKSTLSFITKQGYYFFKWHCYDSHLKIRDWELFFDSLLFCHHIILGPALKFNSWCLFCNILTVLIYSSMGFKSSM